jgi:ABC-type antimicrobial peptide transport system ATPase subunit
VLTWNVDDVVARNCKIEILGIDIGSYCGFLEASAPTRSLAAQPTHACTRARLVSLPSVARTLGLQKKIRDGVNTLSSRVTRVAAPAIAAKLASIINTAIGSTVRIPLRFPL